MTIEQKLAVMNATIVQEAVTLGLVFVNGCNPSPWTPPTANLGQNNGQQRGVYLFALADA